MTLQFPAPAAPSEQPGTPAPQPTFPVYEPQADPSSAQGRMAASAQPAPQLNQDSPLGEFYQVEGENPEAEHGELLFTIAGKPLYAPREEDIDPGIGIRLIRDMRKYGVMVATMNAFGDLLGDEALDLLADAPRMSKEEWGQIMEVLRDKVFSKMTDAIPGGKG